MRGLGRADLPMECDYLVIGGGTAGSIIAARLSEDARRKVVLLEAGKAAPAALLAVPAATVLTGSDPTLNWNYTTAPIAALDGRSLYWSQGKLLGGSAAINGMVYLRGMAQDFDLWRDLGNPGWGWQDVLPWFRRSESNIRGEGPLHGADGPLKVARGQGVARVCDLFLQAAKRAGFRPVDDLNATGLVAGDLPAIGYADLTMARGRRSGPLQDWLAPARKRANLRIVTQAMVERLSIAQGRVTGAQVDHRGARHHITAKAGVILCAGALNSPKILMLSGIGAAQDLHSLGIAPLLERKAVGRDLQNHPSVKLMYRLSAPHSVYGQLRPLSLLAAAARYLHHGGGVFGAGLFPVAGYFHAQSGVPDDLMQFLMAPALVIRRKAGVRGILPQSHGFSLLLHQARPQSRGRVGLVSADPAAPPRIEANYFDNGDDMANMVAGLHRLRGILAEPPLAEILGEPLAVDGSPQDPLEPAEQLIRRQAGTSYHGCGTCRMGSDGDAVVGPDLRLRGLEGLHICDASVMPRLVSGSPYAAVVMLAERASAMISGRE